MRILFHHRTVSRDGQAVHIDEMVASLRALGHEIRIVAPKPASDVAAAHSGGWTDVLRARLPKALYELMELAYSIVAYARLARAAHEFKPDVVYERYNLFLLAGQLLRKRTGVPLLLEVNAPLARERAEFGGLGLPFMARWAEGVAWRNADFVLPVTAVLGREIALRGVAAKRIVVIPNGINEAHFSQVPSPEDAKRALGWPDALVLGFTGYVREWHGVDRVLHWMASDAAPGHARLLIVGDGPARVSLELLARELSLADRVHFTGVLARERVPAHVAAFDIALQPAVVAYASPLKLFEYLVLGKAIVAPRQPNIEEILNDNDNALLFDAADPQAFGSALSRLCSDAALRRRIAARAGTTISLRGLTWARNAERVTALIRDGLANEAARRSAADLNA
jgi:glycosyltransferase involved in cell wall biosynthesis